MAVMENLVFSLIQWLIDRLIGRNPAIELKSNFLLDD